MQTRISLFTIVKKSHNARGQCSRLLTLVIFKNLMYKWLFWKFYSIFYDLSWNNLAIFQNFSSYCIYLKLLSMSLSITNHFFLLSFSLTIIISSSGLWLMCCLATAVTLVIEPWMTRSSLDAAPVLELRIQALKSGWRMHFTFDGQSHSPEL